MPTLQVRKGIGALRLFLACLLICEPPLARADTPISNATPSYFCSSDGRFCARSKQTPPSTAVFERVSQSKKRVWSTQTFIPVGFISEDGKVLVSCYPGLNLVPEDAGLDFVVVKVYRKDHEVENIRLESIYKNINQLVETESHKDWGHCVGFRSGTFQIKRTDGAIWSRKLGAR
jgi:hypothetical protein